MVVRRGPYTVGTERKAQLVRTTERLIREHGHQNVTMRMVAAAVGVSEAAAYHHFSSKDELVVAVLRFRDERAAHRSVTDVVHHMVTVVDENQHEPHVVRLYADMAARASEPGHPAHDFFAARYSTVTGALARAVEVAQDAGELSRRLDPVTTAVVLVSLLDGLQTRWLVTPDLDMAEQVRKLLDALA